MAGITSVILDGLELIGLGTVAPGVEVIVEDVVGWWDTPDTKKDGDSRAIGDGDFSSALINYEARQLTLEGTVHAPDLGSLLAARDRLAGLLAGGRGLLVLEAHGAPAQQAGVERNGKMTFDVVTNTYALLSLSLTCPDPRKYGTVENRLALDPGVTGQITPAGNYPVWPRVTVYGTGTGMPNGYRINGQSRFIRVTDPLTGGEVHEFDMRTGTFRRQGELVAGYTANAKLFSLPPYATSNVSVTPWGGGAYSAATAWYWRDTWI